MSHFSRIILLILVLLGGFWLWKDLGEVDEVEQVDEVAEEEGRTVAPNEFVSDAGVILRVLSPLPDSVISSPLTITGEAPGTWYFEGSFPVDLVDGAGIVQAQGQAQAQDDWMTSEFVPFVVTLEFEKPSYSETGTLFLRRDNPSGLSENDDAIEIPIQFQ